MNLPPEVLGQIKQAANTILPTAADDTPTGPGDDLLQDLQKNPQYQTVEAMREAYMAERTRVENGEIATHIHKDLGTRLIEISSSAEEGAGIPFAFDGNDLILEVPDFENSRNLKVTVAENGQMAVENIGFESIGQTIVRAEELGEVQELIPQQQGKIELSETPSTPVERVSTKELFAQEEQQRIDAAAQRLSIDSQQLELAVQTPENDRTVEQQGLNAAYALVNYPDRALTDRMNYAQEMAAAGMSSGLIAELAGQDALSSTPGMGPQTYATDPAPPTPPIPMQPSVPGITLNSDCAAEVKQEIADLKRSGSLGEGALQLLEESAHQFNCDNLHVLSQFKSNGQSSSMER